MMFRCSNETILNCMFIMYTLSGEHTTTRKWMRIMNEVSMPKMMNQNQTKM